MPSGPKRGALRVWVNLPWNQQIEHLDYKSDRYDPDVVVRAADSTVYQKDVAAQVRTNIYIETIDLPAALSTYIRAQDPSLLRTDDDEETEHLPDNLPVVRKCDDPPIIHAPDFPILERQ